jgi:uncharacterized Zn finger protein
MASKADKSAPTTPQPDPWLDLGWDDLEAWTNPRSIERGRSYQRSGHVQKLARSADGVLVAWVQGQRRYATKVELVSESEDGSRLRSRCTCPVGWNGCKHAVAVVLDYLAAAKEGRAVPAAGPEDRRWERLEDVGDAEEEMAGESDDDDEGFVEPRRRSPQPPRKSKAEKLRPFLEKLSPAELTGLVVELADAYPRVRRDLAERNRLANATDADLIKRAGKMIRRLTNEQVWYNHWSGEGNLPDYGGLKTLLETLLARRRADALLKLGKTLYEGGQAQVGEAHDEGETGDAISSCMEVVFRAVLASSLSDVYKLLYAIDLTSSGEYDLAGGADLVLDHDWPPGVWSQVADRFALRLAKLPPPNDKDFTRNYRRDRITDQLIDCLRNAGRDAEVLPLCEAEAPITGSYQRLVQELLAAGRIDDAKRRALEGIEKVGKQWPGIADQLREDLRAIAAKQQNWPVVAALRAEEFFDYPTIEGLENLLDAAEKAGCGSQVRAAALYFLETGVRPVAGVPTAAVSKTRPRRSAPKPAAAAKGYAGPAWPLPALDPTLRPDRRESSYRPKTGPRPDVLLELAIREKRPDDVLRWYDQLKKPRRSSAYSDWGPSAPDARVADAVADTHPERALTIYQEIVADSINRASPSAYEAALPYLRKMHQLLQRLGREAEWDAYLTGLRETHRRKRRLMEVLDRIEQRRIVDS